ncbi:hypothetical protein DYB30_006508 [Aphanomyces astaci]|uniref:AAA+ ATPase domain-containing protein n=1 Tax=Aphanomyces astaci TaxID=112090 RepID=A0A397E1W6_APHAT|nr:hypothetical protein DYB36_006315 [Aphanomyces astaci]RHY71180.1 hypothetical protein DYB30_006508 [Aphanomyces astaci]RHZ14577.1 hypothetical protein DYB26_004047 [Aphanomyces astaci]
MDDDEILIHPLMVATLLGTHDITGDIALVASVWDDAADATTRPTCVGRLRASTDVAFDSCGLSPTIQSELGLSSLAHVRLRWLTHPPLLPLCILLTPLSAMDNVIDRFLSWSQSCGLMYVLSSQNRITLDTDMQVVVTIQFNDPNHETAVHEYVIVGDGFYLPRRQDVAMGTATQQDAVGAVVIPDQLVTFPGMEPIMTTLWKRLFPVLGRDGCGVRTRMGSVSPPGSIVLHGPRGTGKSSVLAALQAKCKLSFGVMCDTVAVPCRNLRGLKMDSVKAALTAAFDRATHLAPCLVTLDDIDALMPPEDDTSGAAGMSEQSRRLAEHVAAHHAAAIVSQVDSTCDSNWPVFATACSKKSVAVVATAREAQSMHPLLRTCGLFDRPIALSLPDAVARECILRGLVNRAEAVYPPTDEQVQGAVQKTEGFSVRDLTQVVDRAVHHATIRTRQSTTQDRMSLDLLAGLEGFTPAALRGVELFKSSVQWSDIGGLHDIRQTLKDTLELPTKLYAAAPIKLPSGLLLFGPPGCGKTLLANAVANECGLNFISVKGPEVLNKYIGASEQAVRDLFARAAAAAPSVLFLDEFDAMAPRRGADNTGVTDRVVNQLLTFLDGVESRFPNVQDRLDILQAVSRKMDLADDVSMVLPSVAQQTELYSGADLQAVMYAAQLEAVHASIPFADDWDMEFQDSSDSVSFSPKVPHHASKVCASHVQKALAASRPSASIDAKRRYDRMYGSFNNSSQQPRVTEFKTAESNLTFDRSDAAHSTQRSALY